MRNLNIKLSSSLALLGGLALSTAVSAASDIKSSGYAFSDQPVRDQALTTLPLSQEKPLGNFESRKSYVIPALEILSFQFLLNRFDNKFIGSEYDVSASSIRRNLRSSWGTDQDPFLINQVGHPYQGSIYYGAARSTGHSFWGAFGYTFAASAVWEIAGETTPPSRNDQITTSFAGTFLGESLYRMAHLVRERGAGLSPAARELAAAFVSPPTGLNRALSNRFRYALNSQDPAIFSRLQIGASSTQKHTPGGSSSVKHHTEAIADYLLDYGLPGKAGYKYERPWDYFSFQIRASSARPLESLHTRGLIVGVPYEAGSSYRGIWGIYGSYDYLAPQLFRLSSTGLSLGTTGHWQITNALSLLGTASAGVGYTSTGTIRGSHERDYNYGAAPLALVSLRLLMDKSLAFEINARNYFAGNLEDAPRAGKDHVFRGDASLIARLHRNHEFSVKYVTSRRDSSFPDLGERMQRRDTLGLYYTFLSSDI